MIGPVTSSVSDALGFNTVLSSCNCKILALARDQLNIVTLKLNKPAIVDPQIYAMIQVKPVENLLILFMKKLTDQDSIETIRSKLLPLYHKAIADAQLDNDYKILNFFSCEYCQFVAQYCTDIKEVEIALGIQENLLDDINFGLGLIDNTVYADSYEEQLKRHLLLIAKFHEIEINSDVSIPDLIASLATELSSFVSKKHPQEKLQIANYHLAFLMMRVDNLDLFNLQGAYKILKDLLKEQLPEPFIFQVKFRLAELLRQSQNQDIEADEDGFNEMRKLYFEIILTDDDNPVKVNALYSLSQIFNKHELHHPVDLNLCNNFLNRLVLKTKPSSILHTLAYFQLGEFLILGTNKANSNPAKGKEYLTKVIQSNLFNKYILVKLNLFCQLKTEGKAHIDKADNVKSVLPSMSDLDAIRNILVMGIDSCVEKNYYKLHLFYEIHSEFCKKNKNFNAEVFKNLGNELSDLQRNFLSDGTKIYMSENSFNAISAQLKETVLPNLYAADRQAAEDQLLSLQLYQINLSIVFTLAIYQRALISENLVRKQYQEPKYLCASDDIKEANGHFYKNFRTLYGKEDYISLFNLLNFPHNWGIFREMLGRTNRWMYNHFEKDKFYQINTSTKSINGFELQPCQIPSKEILLITIAKTWALLKQLPLTPEFRPGIIQTISMLRFKILSLKLQEFSIANDIKSQKELIVNIHFSKLLYDFDKKLRPSVDPMDAMPLNVTLLDLLGILPNSDKFELSIEMARFNRDQFVNQVYISGLQVTNSLHIAISGYLKAFQLQSCTRRKIEILEELFSFGPQSSDDFVKLIRSLENIDEDERKDYEVSVALLISCRIEYYLFSNQAHLAEELIDKIKNSNVYFKNNKVFFDLFNQDMIQIKTKTEGQYAFQLYANDSQKREKLLTKIGPFCKPDIKYEFEIPAISITKNKPTVHTQKRSLKKNQKSHVTSKSQRGNDNRPAKTDNCEYYDTSSNTPSVTSMSKKAAAEALQKNENKKLLKEQRPNTNSNTQIVLQECSSKTVSKQILPTIIISGDAKEIFNKLWVPHKGAINLDSDEFDVKNYTTDSVLTKDELIQLVTSLGGSYVAGRGSHEKCILSSIDHADKIIINDETIYVSNFASIERATMPIPKEKSGKDYLDGFLIIQFRTKLIQLGYTPLTVKTKDEV